MRSIGIRKAPETYEMTALGWTNSVPQGDFLKNFEKPVRNASSETLYRQKGTNALLMLMIILSEVKGKGRKRALAAFYKTHNRNLFRYAYRFVQDSAAAEDILHDAWTKCLARVDTFFAILPEERIAWMSVLVKNTALDALRKERRHESMDPTEWEPEAREEKGVEEIAEIIRSMPEQYRDVLDLKFLEERTDQEIADILGMSKGAVSTRISRGRKLLQEKLREEGYRP